MSQQSKILDSMAEHLPEGLDESVLVKLSELCADYVEQRVE